MQYPDSLTGATDTPPEKVGWYATLHVWDVQEGFFPGAHYWDGNQWQPDTNAAIRHWPMVFETEQEASAYAWDNDPNW